MDRIYATYAYGKKELISLDEEDVEEIRALLLGHRIEKVANDHLLLDDGTMIRVVPNEGGCVCGAGDYELKSLSGVDNIITKVDFVTTDRYGEDAYLYEVFVVVEDKRINLFAVEGDDGNGYYGTGYQLLVRAP